MSDQNQDRDDRRDDDVHIRREPTEPQKGRQVNDEDSTYRYSESWGGAADTSTGGDTVSGNMERYLDDTRSSDAGDPYTPDVTQGRESPRNDKELHDMIYKYMTKNGKVDSSNIYVDVEQGVVTLRGAAADSNEKNAAAEVVRQVPGVREVNNLLQIMNNKPLHTGGPEVQRYGPEDDQERYDFEDPDLDKHSY